MVYMENKNKFQKLILPGLFVAIILLLFFTYFAPSDELGDFNKFDKNNNASLPIVVKLVKEKGIKRTSDGGSIFYVIDKNNKMVEVSGPGNLPPGMDDAPSLTITGHLSGNGFHAHGVELRN